MAWGQKPHAIFLSSHPLPPSLPEAATPGHPIGPQPIDPPPSLGNPPPPGSMTLANKITIARILLIPVFVVFVVYHHRTGSDTHRWLALATFLLASISDALDGWIARRFNQRSQLGATLDPLADKLLLVSALILLSRSNLPDTHVHVATLPLWLTATVLSRDALLILGWIIIRLTCGHVTMKPYFISKAGTVLQMSAIVLALADAWPILRGWSAAAAAITTGLSTVLYVRDGVAQLAAHPLSSPQPPSPPPSAPTQPEDPPR